MGASQSAQRSTPSKTSRDSACQLDTAAGRATVQRGRRAGTPQRVPSETKLLQHIQLLATFSQELGDIAGKTHTLCVYKVKSPSVASQEVTYIHAQLLVDHI